MIRSSLRKIASSSPLRSFADSALPDLIVTKECAQRILKLKKMDASSQAVLRLAVDGGGCSGFQYTFELLDEYKREPEDVEFERDGALVVVDEDSLEFVKGATVDFVQEMIKSSFVVTNNPNSESACGCGSSFALKNFSANPALD